MSTIFDQRFQDVVNQINVVGDYIAGAQSKVDVIKELEKLPALLNQAAEQGLLDAEKAVDVESEIKKAIILAKKPQPEKKGILERLKGAKTLIEGVSAAGGLISALVKAVEVVQKFF